jgi:hypothetical protein
MGVSKLKDNLEKKNHFQSVKKINILVVGDWVIDEDWVMMPERSETSAKQSDKKQFHTAFDDLNVAAKRSRFMNK